MLTLYYSPTCAFSQDVLAYAEEKHIKLRLKDISSDPVNEAELLTLGGRHQTPFLIDDSSGVRLYDSPAIIEYLTQHAVSKPSSFGGLRVHVSEDHCDGCE